VKEGVRKLQTQHVTQAQLARNRITKLESDLELVQQMLTISGLPDPMDVALKKSKSKRFKTSIQSISNLFGSFGGKSGKSEQSTTNLSNIVEEPVAHEGPTLSCITKCTCDGQRYKRLTGFHLKNCSLHPKNVEKRKPKHTAKVQSSPNLGVQKLKSMTDALHAKYGSSSCNFRGSDNDAHMSDFPVKHYNNVWQQDCEQMECIISPRNRHIPTNTVDIVHTNTAGNRLRRCLGSFSACPPLSDSFLELGHNSRKNPLIESSPDISNPSTASMTITDNPIQIESLSGADTPNTSNDILGRHISVSSDEISSITPSGESSNSSSHIFISETHAVPTASAIPSETSAKESSKTEIAEEYLNLLLPSSNDVFEAIKGFLTNPIF